jgi:hypothetical protein
MQTFLPHPDFGESVCCLDRQRLGKQRIESWQVYKALTTFGYGWQSHPVVKMWRGYEIVLLVYGSRCCQEWQNRGYKDTMLQRFRVKLTERLGWECMQEGFFDRLDRPRWLGDERFHRSHQSNLVRKLPEHYGPFFPGVPDDIPYFWPTKEGY